MSNKKIKDGNTEFRVVDKRLFSILDLLYPVGRIIISNDSTAPYSDIGFGTWEEMAKGAFVEGADDSHKAGDNIDAGLPNITGEVGPIDDMSNQKITKAFYKGSGYNYDAKSDSNSGGWILGFDASRCSSVYGNSDTVQPKAYVSHYWLRVK